MPWHLYRVYIHENGGNLIQQGLWFGWHDDFILMMRTSVDVMRRRIGEQGECGACFSDTPNTKVVTKQFYWQRSLFVVLLDSSHVWCAYFRSALVFALALHMEGYLYYNLLIFSVSDDSISATRMVGSFHLYLVGILDLNMLFMWNIINFHKYKRFSVDVDDVIADGNGRRRAGWVVKFRSQSQKLIEFIY